MTHGSSRNHEAHEAHEGHEDLRGSVLEGRRSGRAGVIHDRVALGLERGDPVCHGSREARSRALGDTRDRKQVADLTIGQLREQIAGNVRPASLMRGLTSDPVFDCDNSATHCFGFDQMGARDHCSKFTLPTGLRLNTFGVRTSDADR